MKEEVSYATEIFFSFSSPFSYLFYVQKTTFFHFSDINSPSAHSSPPAKLETAEKSFSIEKKNILMFVEIKFKFNLIILKSFFLHSHSFSAVVFFSSLKSSWKCWREEKKRKHLHFLHFMMIFCCAWVSRVNYLIEVDVLSLLISSFYFIFCIFFLFFCVVRNRENKKKQCKKNFLYFWPNLFIFFLTFFQH